jgi:hypothetical protein
MAWLTMRRHCLLKHVTDGKTDERMEVKGRRERSYRTILTFGTRVLHLIQINHQPDATIVQFIILSFKYSSTSFGRFPAHHQELSDCSGSLWFYLRIVVIVVLCSWSVRPARSARPRTTTLLSPRSNGKTRGCYCSCCSS